MESQKYKNFCRNFKKEILLIKERNNLISQLFSKITDKQKYAIQSGGGKKLEELKKKLDNIVNENNTFYIKQLETLKKTFNTDMIKIVTEPLLERFKLTMDDSKNIMDKYKTIITGMKEENKNLEGVNTKLTKCTTELKTCKSDLTKCRTQLEEEKERMKIEKENLDKQLGILQGISDEYDGVKKELNLLLKDKTCCDDDFLKELKTKLEDLQEKVTKLEADNIENDTIITTRNTEIEMLKGDIETLKSNGKDFEIKKLKEALSMYDEVIVAVRDFSKNKYDRSNYESNPYWARMEFTKPQREEFLTKLKRHYTTLHRYDVIITSMPESEFQLRQMSKIKKWKKDGFLNPPRTKAWRELNEPKEVSREMVHAREDYRKYR
jgi:DNA repair exonuclease SbcCD ATPase subunit